MKSTTNATQIRLARQLEVSVLAAERWKVGVSCARIPTPDAAISMLRSRWSKSDQSRMWTANFGSFRSRG